MTGIYDLKPAAFGRPSNNKIALSDEYGKQIEQWNGVDISAQARLQSGVMVSGGVSTGKTVADYCEIVSKLPEMLRFVHATSAKFDIKIANVFHAGDGNIHPILLFDERDPDQVKRVLQASHDILSECIRLGGSVTGEHGIGAIGRPDRRNIQTLLACSAPARDEQEHE